MLSSLYRQSMIKVLRVPFNVGSSIVTAHFSSTNVNQKESFGTKGLTIVQDLRGLKNAPLPALTLGISGLIPFIAAPWYMTHNGLFIDSVLAGQLAYGASILSFLGGVRWGMLVVPTGPVRPDWVQYVYSVTPSLVAWSALMMPAVPGVLTCATGLGLAGYCDLIQSGYPTWFRGLRILLTSFAIASLVWSLLCSALLDTKNPAGAKVEAKKDEKVH